MEWSFHFVFYKFGVLSHFLKSQKSCCTFLSTSYIENTMINVKII